MLWIHNRRIHVRENPELVRHADVVTVRRNSVTDHSLAHLPVRERLDHLVLQRHAPDPTVWLNGHPFLPWFYLRLVDSLRSAISQHRKTLVQKRFSVDYPSRLDNPRRTL